MPLASRLLPLALLLCAVQVAAGDATWPEVPEPPRSKVEWVVYDSHVNGLPTRIRKFESELSADQVLNFYRQQWKTAKIGEPQQTQSGSWIALSTLNGGVQTTVQVKARGTEVRQGSEGMLSMMDFGRAKSDFIPVEIPQFAQKDVTQVTESVDGPKRSRLVNIVSAETLESATRRWRSEWLRRGWRLAFESPANAPQAKSQWLASFDKERSSVDVVISYQADKAQSYITVNLIDAGGAK